MATSAAPTIFPLAEIGDSLYADGGLFANSPDALGCHEATQFLGISEENIHCLSIGTTMQKFSFGHKTGINLGIVDWATNQRLLQAMLSSQQQSVDFMMQHRLGDRYQRIDRFPSPEQSTEIGLDKASPNAIRNLKGLGAEDFKTAVGNPKIMEFFNHTAPDPTFYHGPNAKKDK
jgi:patatin-like phospholipase/acyl hydrolase